MKDMSGKTFPQSNQSRIDHVFSPATCAILKIIVGLQGAHCSTAVKSQNLG